MSILINGSQVLLTTRNVLIANLAVTDLLLSTTAIPLTLLDVIYKYWPLGEDMVRMNVFLLTHVSTLTAELAVQDYRMYSVHLSLPLQHQHLSHCSGQIQVSH